MNYVDKASMNMRKYMPELTKEADFDSFWENTISQTKEVELNLTKEKVEYPIDTVDVYDISYNGFDDTKIHGWYLVPKLGKEKYPCLIHYHGLGGSAGYPCEYMHWVMAGMAVLTVDCREQFGRTGNSMKITSGMSSSVMCRGILDKNEYYYRAVYMDALKAIDAAISMGEVDEHKIVIEGGSQGGALVMAVAAFDQRVALALADVPSSSDLTTRVEREQGAFGAVTQYLKHHPEHTEQALKTLSYFDTMNLANRIECKVLASVGLKDPVAPAELYFATYNRIKSEKKICMYPFNGHEGGGSRHTEEKLKFIKEHL